MANKSIPPLDLSLVLHDLTKQSFERLGKASLKLLTSKAVFLLTLASGKRRSEIHAWTSSSPSYKENWSQVTLVPSNAFLAKNQSVQLSNLDRTKDIRKNILFVSIKKGFTRDIFRATISFWLKQTILLAYEKSDYKSHQLCQVKAHDVRSLAASLAFEGGVSSSEILEACFWKSHNTFTNFYLKDLC